MSFFSTFLRLAEWALDAVFIPRVLIVCVLALASLTLAAKRQKPFERHLRRPYHWLTLTHLLFFPAVIAAGMIWANPITNPSIPHRAVEAGQRWLDVLMYASLASCVWWVWRMRGFRWFAASLMLLGELLLFCARSPWWPNSDFVVHGILNPLFATEISFRLDEGFISPESHGNLL